MVDDWMPDFFCLTDRVMIKDECLILLGQENGWIKMSPLGPGAWTLYNLIGMNQPSMKICHAMSLQELSDEGGGGGIGIQLQSVLFDCDRGD